MSDSARPETAAHQAPCPWDSPGKNTGVAYHFLLQCVKVKSESEVAQSCPTLRDPMDCSLPGSSIHGIFQARVLEWCAIAFSVFPYSEMQGMVICSFPRKLLNTVFIPISHYCFYNSTLWYCLIYAIFIDVSILGFFDG